MRIVMFCHSLMSDWNNSSAHFLRGVACELLARGIEVTVYEPRGAWSVQHLLADHGPGALAAFHRAYPTLRSVRYEPASLDLDQALEGADLVLVHEWNDPELVRRLGEHRAKRGRYQLLFHDTRDRSATREMPACRLEAYDGVLAFGAVLRDLYSAKRWARRVWVWHEAADIRRFHPLPRVTTEGDLVWIGTWGVDEQSDELREFLAGPGLCPRSAWRSHHPGFRGAGLRHPPGVSSVGGRRGSLHPGRGFFAGPRRRGDESPTAVRVG